ncbi:Parvalbumin [Parasponia andersonii]|uniref:Parvalbumin n=1 Tax=Parasponia andersonii TaxID=3476 RepID=A0A2P5BZD7_PARAD|nr:Parvalbumin [Parasponia andersonii]
MLTKTITLSKLPSFVKVLFWDINGNYDIISGLKLLLVQPLLNFVSKTSPKFETKKIMSTGTSASTSSSGPLEFRDEEFSKEEVKMVMNKLGIMIYGGREHGDDYVPQREAIGGEELLGLFEEEEPSLEELKEAFDVFDDNKDGFIDAQELGRVLSNLGLLIKESGSIIRDECLRNMIKNVDENQDGVVDFNEFVKFMESCFF